MADEAEARGMAAAVQLAIAQAGRALDLPDELQLPLLPAPEPADGGDQAGEAGPRGRGRPAGARNRRTQEIADYLLARYRSPLEGLAAIQGRNVRVLAAELGLEAPSFDQLVELLRLQIKAAEALAPYVHQKQPVAVQVDSRGVVQLVIERHHDGAARAEHGGAGVRMLDVTPVTDESENNEKSEG